MKYLYFFLSYFIVTIGVYAQTGRENGHEWVDLGLSVKWATCNVGANSPKEHGDYYAWGETQTKNYYDWDSCIDCLDKKGDNWDIYKVGGKTKITPDSRHDTARKNWGGAWRMPSKEEFDELCEKCTWKWITDSRGFEITGPNGNSIYLSAGGCWIGWGLWYEGVYGNYWTSSLDPSDSGFAHCLCFYKNNHSGTNSDGRRRGLNIRPVLDLSITTQDTSRSQKNMINGHEYVDLGLSVKWATCNVGANSPEEYGYYYAWGEIRTKNEFYWINCFDYHDKGSDKWGIYKIGGKTRIAPNSRHDTARENWGGTWRMPSVEEFDELCKKCTWKWTKKKGIYGYEITGPNGDWIFLPATGFLGGNASYLVGNFGSYWSSTLDSSYSSRARILGFRQDRYYTRDYDRCNGTTVRPVTE